MTPKVDQPPREQQEDSQAVHNRLVTIGWALFLILIGVIWLIPEVPEGSFFIGVGLILLGLNLVKYLQGLKTSEPAIFLGIIALIIGFINLLAIRIQILLPIIVILLGLIILFTALFKKKSA